MSHISPFQVILTAALIAAFLYIRKKKAAAQGPALPGKGGGAPRAVAERPVKPQEPPEVVFEKLRRRALETTPESLGQAGAVSENEPYGVLMEMGMQDSVVTLACFADGDAGLYYRSGGGVKGGIAHDNVRKVAKEFVALAPKVLPKMVPSTTHPLPGAGKVRFYALTHKGVFTREMDREALGESPNEFSELFYSGQEVVTQMRQVQAQRSS